MIIIKFVKGRNFLYWISIIGLIFPFLAIFVVANPVIIPNPYESSVFRAIIIVIMFNIAVGVEYLTINCSKLNKSPREDNVFFIVLKINLITIPPIQILAYIVFTYFYSFFWFYVLGIEVLVIIVEWFLLRAGFRKKYDRILPTNYSLIIVIIANAASFLLGLIPFLF